MSEQRVCDNCEKVLRPKDSLEFEYLKFEQTLYSSMYKRHNKNYLDFCDYACMRDYATGKIIEKTDED